jgi:hypothetical protein
LFGPTGEVDKPGFEPLNVGLIEIRVLAREDNRMGPEVLLFVMLFEPVFHRIPLADIERHGGEYLISADEEIDAGPIEFLQLPSLAVQGSGDDETTACAVRFLDESDPIGIARRDEDVDGEAAAGWSGAGHGYRWV